MIYPPAYNGKIILKIGAVYKIKIKDKEYDFFNTDGKRIRVFDNQIMTLVDIQFITVDKCNLKFILNDTKLDYRMTTNNEHGYMCNFEELTDNDN